MNRIAFEYLYIHANSLAELGLDQCLAGLDLMAADGVDELAHLSAAERDALALAHMSKMDMSSMMDGFIWETPEHDADVQSALLQLQAEAELAASAPPLVAQELALQPPAGDWPDEPVSSGLNLALYLENAYAVADQIAPRVDAGMGRLDMNRLAALLAALPCDLAPLTGALDADALAQWLACYQAGHASLEEIVAMYRGLAVDY